MTGSHPNSKTRHDRSAADDIGFGSIPRGDLLTMSDIADLLGVGYDTVRKWRWRSEHQPAERTYRGAPRIPFPDAYMTIGSVPCWERDTIVAWAQQTNRLSEEHQP